MHTGPRLMLRNGDHWPHVATSIYIQSDDVQFQVHSSVVQATFDTLESHMWPVAAVLDGTVQNIATGRAVGWCCSGACLQSSKPVPPACRVALGKHSSLIGPYPLAFVSAPEILTGQP